MPAELLYGSRIRQAGNIINHNLLQAVHFHVNGIFLRQHFRAVHIQIQKRGYNMFCLAVFIFSGGER